MTTVEEVLCKAKDLADAAGKKTGELVNLTKLRMEAAETQKAISDKLEAVGRVIYEAHKQEEGAAAPENLEALFTAINALEEKAAEITDKMDELRRTKHCSNCGKNNAADAAFCQGCGQKL